MRQRDAIEGRPRLVERRGPRGRARPARGRGGSDRPPSRAPFRTPQWPSASAARSSPARRDEPAPPPWASAAGPTPADRARPPPAVLPCRSRTQRQAFDRRHTLRRRGDHLLEQRRGLFHRGSCARSAGRDTCGRPWTRGAMRAARRNASIACASWPSERVRRWRAAASRRDCSRRRRRICSNSGMAVGVPLLHEQRRRLLDHRRTAGHVGRPRRVVADDRRRGGADVAQAGQPPARVLVQARPEPSRAAHGRNRDSRPAPCAHPPAGWRRRRGSSSRRDRPARS